MNKEKLLLVGAGGFGRVVLEHAIKEYDCAFVDDGVATGTTVCGVPVIGATSDLDELHEEYHNLIVTIGNNSLREQIYKKSKIIGYTFPNIIDSSAYISDFATIGNGCIILNNVVIQNGSRVGDGVILNPGVEIHHDSIVGDHVLIYTNAVVRSLASIGDRAHIGSTLTISNEARVEHDAIIPDGCSVKKEGCLAK